ncbi:unnamed protein product [Urochloa decumbens]|uniref:Disease resistance N-terminal domain-containing protein n=1 Tax=Urochloa decumbens TaxID=240449 RepID=A0ABC9FNP6_9POAL
MSAAVRRYTAHASVGEQLERLGTLVVMMHSAVDAAEGVHIRSWWLRRWLWRLRDAALDGDEVLRSLTRRRQKAEEESGGRLWNAARRVFRSAKSLLLLAGDDSTARLSASVEAAGAAAATRDDPKVSRTTSLRSQPAGRKEKEGPSFMATERYVYPRPVRRCPDPSDRHNLVIKEEILHGVLDVPPPPPRYHVGGSSDEEESSEPSTSLDGSSESEHDDPSYSSYKEHNAARRGLARLIVCAQHIRRVMNKLTTRTPAAPPPASPWSVHLWTTLYHPARLRVVVGDIRRVLRDSDRPEVHGKRWLAEWRRELQAVVDRADRVLIPVSEAVAGAETGVVATASRDVVGDDEVRRTSQSVHTAAAHLKCFVTLVRLAVSQGIAATA